MRDPPLRHRTGTSCAREAAVDRGRPVRESNASCRAASPGRRRIDAVADHHALSRRQARSRIASTNSRCPVTVAVVSANSRCAKYWRAPAGRGHRTRTGGSRKEQGDCPRRQTRSPRRFQDATRGLRRALKLGRPASKSVGRGPRRVARHSLKDRRIRERLRTTGRPVFAAALAA